jgi:cytochrome b involved in lipid metabolism
MRLKVIYARKRPWPLIVLISVTVAKHNTKDSCWVILYGNVYDVCHSNCSKVYADSNI